jgi:hypothetical protein
MSINWQDFERPSGGDYNRWKPETEGDSIGGKIVAIRIATMPDGNKYPSLTISKGGDNYEVLASQTQLLRLLAEKKPAVGDDISITFARTEKLAGNKTLKHFEVKITAGKPVNADELI